VIHTFKGKVVSRHATKVLEGVKEYLHAFLISALDGNGQFHPLPASLMGNSPWWIQQQGWMI